MNLPKALLDLPVSSCQKEILGAIKGGDLILEAPPGTGKTTAVPIFLLPAVSGKIIMLEPRRLAARGACYRMAAILGEDPGRTVGYRTRLDTLVSSATRIEIVTEGVFTRIIQQDPALEGVGAVIFDEFHERSLQCDLGFVLARESKESLNPELRLLIMSATLPENLCDKLKGFQKISVPGAMHPVKTEYLAPEYQEKLESLACRGIRRVLGQEASGDVLVFLPGVGEITRVREGLQNIGDVEVLLLHGLLDKEDQDKVMGPSAKRRVILSTAIAESSLTVPGVRHVIDLGLQRFGSFDSLSGMSSLVTQKASLSSVEQRRGRAGRLGPGTCLRLWDARTDSLRKEAEEAEILHSDLSSLALALAVWGEKDYSRMDWLTPPPSDEMKRARDLLRSMGALDSQGAATKRGRLIESMPLHPRLGAMLLKAREAGFASSAAFLAGLIESRELLAGKGTSLLQEAVYSLKGRLPYAAEKTRKQALRLLHEEGDKKEGADFGRILSWAYPDRIGKSRGSDGIYLLAGGLGAELKDLGLKGREPEYIVAASLDCGERNAKIFLYAPLEKKHLLEDFKEEMREEESLEWDRKREKVLASRQTKFGAITLKAEEAREVSKAQSDLLLQKTIEEELRPLQMGEEALDFCRRCQCAHLHFGQDWPAFDLKSLIETAHDWLRPALKGLASFEDLGSLGILSLLHRRLGHERLYRLDKDFPVKYPLPGGRQGKINYDDPERPLLAAKVQDIFGLTANPKIASGRLTLGVQLLSPANRPVQVTFDMAGFWTNSYPLLRKELKGRYPKHSWPESPTVADAPKPRSR